MRSSTTLLCLLSLVLLASAAVSSAHSSKKSATASQQAALEYDPDEIEGVPDTEAGVELTLGDDDEPTKPASETASIWVDPNAPPPSAIPSQAFDNSRTAKSLDWLHLHYEVRLISAEDEDRTTLIWTTRKLGRDPWVMQLGSLTSLPTVDETLHGISIGEKRTATLKWREGDESYPPHFASSDSLREGQSISITFELIRFDQNVKEVTLEDRFWNMLPMIAFFGFMGFRIMRGEAAGVGAAEQAGSGNKKQKSKKK